MKIAKCLTATTIKSIHDTFDTRLQELRDSIKAISDQIRITDNPENKGSLRKRKETLQKQRNQLQLQRDAQLLTVRKVRLEQQP